MTRYEVFYHYYDEKQEKDQWLTLQVFAESRQKASELVKNEYDDRYDGEIEEITDKPSAMAYHNTLRQEE